MGSDETIAKLKARADRAAAVAADLEEMSVALRNVRARVNLGVGADESAKIVMLAGQACGLDARAMDVGRIRAAKRICALVREQGCATCFC